MKPEDSVNLKILESIAHEYRGAAMKPGDAPCYYCSFHEEQLTPMACEYCIHNPLSRLFDTSNPL
jgi:hypothetical protein